MSLYDKIQKSMNVMMPGSAKGEMIEKRTDFSVKVPPMPRQADTTISGVKKGKF